MGDLRSSTSGSNPSPRLDLSKCQSAPAPPVSISPKEIQNLSFSEIRSSADDRKMSPFAARARARALERRKTSVQMPSGTSSMLATPRDNSRGRMRSITDDSWTVVTHKKSLTSSFKPIGFDKTEVGMTNQEKIAAQAGRTKLCRHFLLGHCPHGDTCTYAHDISVMKPTEQKVFIGGIPSGCTSRQLITAVEKAGFKVINIPKCHPSGFAPKVCLESVEAAKQLLKIARIDIEGHTTDVRKYNDSRAANTDNAAVIVSGLPEGTTGYQLLQGLEKAGFLIERSPIVAADSTVCERCEMATVEQADALVAIEMIECLGTTLTFKPFSCVDDSRVRSRMASIKPPASPGGLFGGRSPRSAVSTFGGSRRRTFGSFMNRALPANLSFEG